MPEKWILVAPWGNPTGWGKVTYIPPKIPPQGCRDLWKGDDIDHGSEGIGIESQSSSAAIARYIYRMSTKGNANIDLKVLIIMSETLTDPGKICGEGCEEKNIVDRIKSSVETDYRKYVEIYFGGDLAKKVEILIAPGIGLFKRDRGEARFRCIMNNYTSYILANLVNRIVREDPTTILLDITHGINYMPLLTSEAVRAAIELSVLRKSAISGGKNTEIRLIYLNSDPYIQPRGVAGSHPQQATAISSDVLNINVIRCEEIDAEMARRRIYSDLLRTVTKSQSLRLYRIKSGKPKQEINAYVKDVEKDIKSVATIVKILDRGLLLPLVYKARELQNTTEGGGKCGDLFRSGWGFEALNNIIRYVDEVSIERNISGERRVIEVGRQLWVDPEILRLWISSCIIISEILEKVKRYVESTGDWATLDLLDDIVESNLIPSEASLAIARREVSDIRCRSYIAYRVFGNTILDREIPYKYIYNITEKFFKIAEERYGSSRWIWKLCEEKEPRFSTGGEYADKLGEIVETLEKDLGDHEKIRDCDSGDCEFDERNFYAHAGIEKNVTCIKIEKNRGSDGSGILKIYLRYRRQCVDNIMKIVEKAA